MKDNMNLNPFKEAVMVVAMTFPVGPSQARLIVAAFSHRSAGLVNFETTNGSNVAVETVDHPGDGNSHFYPVSVKFLGSVRRVGAITHDSSSDWTTVRIDGNGKTLSAVTHEFKTGLADVVEFLLSSF